MGKTKVGTLNNSDPYRPTRKSEKQDILANGESWPVCKCHGVPKLWDGSWRCRVLKQQKSARWRDHYRDNGMCVACAQPEHVGACLFYYENQIKKYSTLLALDKDDPEYIAIVRKEQTIG